MMMIIPSPKNRFVPAHALVIGLALFSFALSAIFSATVFERLPHIEDEVAYVYHARVFARGALMGESIAPASAFWQPFVIEHSSGTRFSKYPPVWSGLLAFGVANGAGWIVNAFLSALIVALTYRLGREIFGRETGVVAAGLTAFSPMGILLGASLMSHTAALFFVTLFLYGYWRLSTRARPHLWGMIAGGALGLLIGTRPLTAVAIAFPLVVWSVLRLARVVYTCRPPLRGVFLRATLTPLLALTGAALLFGAVHPAYNALATGNPWQNLYTLVPGWEYDRVGFGEGYGRSGHTLQRGIQHMRYDLSLTAADLFGWQWGMFTPEPAADYNTALIPSSECDTPTGAGTLQQHLRTCNGYWHITGLSWLLLIPALALGWRRVWVAGWLVFGAGLVAVLPSAIFNAAEVWALMFVGWGFAPLVFLTPRMDESPRANWTWILFAVMFCLIVAHWAYWVGSQRYSTRYYAEALSAVAILSAVPVGYALREARARGWRWAHRALRVACVAVCLWSLTQYSVYRIGALYGYNSVTQGMIDAVEARREGDAPLLVLMTSDSPRRWRSHGALMAVTEPWFDGEITVAWVDDGRDDLLRAVLGRFPNHQVIEMRAQGDFAWFPDTCDANTCPIVNDPAGGRLPVAR